MKEILREAAAALKSGETVALSTIVSGSGSLPMSRRSKMLVRADGTLRGTVGGGCLEAEVYEAAREALRGDGSPRLKRFVLTEEQAGAEGLNCGGTVEILTEALSPGPVEEVLSAGLQRLERRVPAVMVTALDRPGGAGPGKLLVEAGVAVAGSLGEEPLDREALARAREMTEAASARMIPAEGGVRLFLEPLPVVPRLILYGGGHVSRETARVAAAAGFQVLVADDRPAFASARRHPDAHETRVISFDQAARGMEIDSETYLVVVTRGHQHDEKVVEQLLGSPAAYLGMIGSTRKVAIMRRNLSARGVAAEELDRVHAPVGLEIGADNPGEIAVSIVAELIAVRRMGGHPGSMKGRLRGRA